MTKPPKSLSLRAVLAIALAAAPLATLTGCGSDKEATSRRMNREPAPPPPVPPAQQTPLDPALQQAARNELYTAVESPDAPIRAHAIEAMRETLGVDAADVIVKHLSDPAAIVRFSAAVAAGELRLPQAREALLALSEDPDPSARIAAKFALHRLGDTRQSHDLETTSRDSSPRSAATPPWSWACSESPPPPASSPPCFSTPAPPSACRPLRRCRLGDERGLDALISGSISKFPDDQMIALLALAGPKDRRRSVTSRDNSPPTTPRSRSLPPALPACSAPTPATASRSSTSTAPTTAAECSPPSHSAPSAGPMVQTHLAPLLKDPDPDVRVAAAQAILQLKS